MICKSCKGDLIPIQDRIEYKKTTWNGAGKYAGAFEYSEQYITDAGIFCSSSCLIDYLQQH